MEVKRRWKQGEISTFSYLENTHTHTTLFGKTEGMRLHHVTPEHPPPPFRLSGENKPPSTWQR